jgi:hypothetical protein
MTIIQMKEAIIAAYPSDSWQAKVEAMSDNQIIAVYNQLLSTGKLDEQREKNKRAALDRWYCTRGKKPAQKSSEVKVKKVNPWQDSNASAYEYAAKDQVSFNL